MVTKTGKRTVNERRRDVITSYFCPCPSCGNMSDFSVGFGRYSSKPRSLKGRCDICDVDFTAERRDDGQWYLMPEGTLYFPGDHNNSASMYGRFDPKDCDGEAEAIAVEITLLDKYIPSCEIYGDDSHIDAAKRRLGYLIKRSYEIGVPLFVSRHFANEFASACENAEDDSHIDLDRLYTIADWADAENLSSIAACLHGSIDGHPAARRMYEYATKSLFNKLEGMGIESDRDFRMAISAFDKIIDIEKERSASAIKAMIGRLPAKGKRKRMTYLQTMLVACMCDDADRDREIEKAWELREFAPEAFAESVLSYGYAMQGSEERQDRILEMIDYCLPKVYYGM